MLTGSNGQKLVTGVPKASVVKPWRGPLPPVRASPKFTLADSLARARRAARADEGCLVPGGLDGAPPPALEKTGNDGASMPAGRCSIFESPRQSARDPGVGGRRFGEVASGPDRSLLVRLGGRPAHFTFSSGLCALFNRAGRLRSLMQAACATPPRDALFLPRIQAASVPVSRTVADQRKTVEGVMASAVDCCGIEMDRWKVDGHGRGQGASHGDKKGRFPGGGRGLQADGLGFDPGYGDGRGHHGRGWPRNGPRLRGSRGYAPRRGGFAGRQGRGGRVGRHGGMEPPIAPATMPVSDAADSEVNQEEVIGEEKEFPLAGKKDKVCSRCTQKGHSISDCSTQVYCVICDGHDHVNHCCHLLKQARPVAHAVGYAVEGLGFYHIPHPPLSRKKDSKTALVKVVVGTLTVDQVTAQLQRVVSSRWNWEPVLHDKDSFVVPFPSKNELQRAMPFGGADVRGNSVPMGLRMQFEEWHEEEEGFLLPKVWIRITGIRRKLREFQNLWAIGSMLGSTQTVDMETTCKNNFGHVLVAVLDPKLLPSNLDVVIGDHYFELKFEVEPVGFDDNGEEVQFNFKDGNNDGSRPMEEDDPNGEHGLDREGKCSRRDRSTDVGQKDAEPCYDGTGANGTKEVSSMAVEQNEDVEEKIRKMANEIMDMVVDMTLEYCVDKVLAEEDVEYEIMG